VFATLLVSNGPLLARADRDGRKIDLRVRFGQSGWRRIEMFVAVVAVASVVPVSLLVSMVRRVATRTVDCCLEQCATRCWWFGWR
jgi:hypothetical protein